MTRSTPTEICAGCAREIRSPEIPCVNAGRVLCGQCDSAQRLAAVGEVPRPAPRANAAVAVPRFAALRIAGGLLAGLGAAQAVGGVAALVWAMSMHAGHGAELAAITAASMIVSGVFCAAVGEALLAIRHIARNSFQAVALLKRAGT